MIAAGDDRDVQTVGWVGDAAGGFLRLIDQTRLPTELVRIDLHDVPAVWEAIRSLRVRGAPAIGIAAAFGVVVGGQSAREGDTQAVRDALLAASTTLRTSRPTAVNLFWALDRMVARALRDRELDLSGLAMIEGLLERLVDGVFLLVIVPVLRLIFMFVHQTFLS